LLIHTHTMSITKTYHDMQDMAVPEDDIVRCMRQTFDIAMDGSINIQPELKESAARLA